MEERYIAHDGKIYDDNYARLLYDNNALFENNHLDGGRTIAGWLEENRDAVLEFLSADNQKRYVKRTGVCISIAARGEVFELHGEGDLEFVIGTNGHTYNNPLGLDGYWSQCDKDGNEL